MAQDPSSGAGLSDDRVAELEEKLAAAAAEVADVQAQLAQATGGAPVPPVPYGELSVDGLDRDLDGVRSSPERVAPLADPPRHVPFAYKLATFNLKVYELFMLLMAFVAPIAVWVFWPEVFPAALVAAVLAVAWFRIRTYLRRNAILRWGKVVTVTNHDVLSEGTYFGGVTYNNMRMRQASGWDMTTSWYSGPGYTNKVDFMLDGVPGSLKFRGLRYGDGVVLADSRKPSRAMCVSQFPYSVKPGPDGQLTGELSAWMWGGIIATIVIEGTLVYLAVISVLGTYVN